MNALRHNQAVYERMNGDHEPANSGPYIVWRAPDYPAKLTDPHELMIEITEAIGEVDALVRELADLGVAVEGRLKFVADGGQVAVVKQIGGGV